MSKFKQFIKEDSKKVFAIKDTGIKNKTVFYKKTTGATKGFGWITKDSEIKTFSSKDKAATFLQKVAEESPHIKKLLNDQPNRIKIVEL